MNATTLLALCLLPLLNAPAALAEDNTQRTVSAQASLSQGKSLANREREVGGLVVAQTVTLAGRAFYENFAAAWADLDTGGHYSVTVIERPTVRLGSQVFVDYGNRRLLQMFLPPNRSQIPPIASDAAGQVYQAVLDYQIAQFFGDPDLGRDEF